MGYDDLNEFIRDFNGIPEGDIPLHAPVLKGKEKEYLLTCIDIGYVSSVGAFVERFEQMVVTNDEALGAKIRHLSTTEAGVHAGLVWPPLNRLPMYEHAVTDHLERTVYFADRFFNLPGSVMG